MKVWQPQAVSHDPMEEIAGAIHDKLIRGVLKRMDADAPVGYLLSGGLDSSLVCAIAQAHSKTPIRTFAIGMAKDAIDLKYARMVADYIHSDHTEVLISREDVLDAWAVTKHLRIQLKQEL
jgi:asparagine synthase (glutamine-hydrolysing)